MKTLILFDVDGTLTVSRKIIKQNMIDQLAKMNLIEDLDLGIVGGSDLEKQKEQVKEENFKYFTYIFSENGLMAYYNGELLNKTSFKDELGEENLKKLIKF